LNGSPSTVNTSANSFGVGAGQSIDPGEILNFQFRDVISQVSTTVASATFSTEKLTLSIGESLTWTAFATNGTVLGSGTVAGVSGGIATFTVSTAQLGGSEFSSISFATGNNSTSYKLIIDSLSAHTQLYDQAISVNVAGVDGDGDPSSNQSLNITFDSGTTLLVAGSESTAIGGGSGNDTLTGGTANDTLNAGAGNDTLVGGAGNDILIGGKGSDTLTGGLGADTFRWELGDGGTTAAPAIDTVKDFDNVANSDKLDLRDLLVGESHTGTSAGNLASFLHFTYSSGTNTTTVEVKSSSALAAPDQIINLEGVNLVGTFTSDAAIIQDLFTRGKLVTD